MGATCPNCGKDSLEPIAGQFDTGVVAPDGGRESRWESGYQCSKCGAYTDDAELDQLEPTDPVECEYHEVTYQGARSDEGAMRKNRVTNTRTA